MRACPRTAGSQVVSDQPRPVPSPALTLHRPICRTQLQGYAAASNVRGTVFLETIGINPSELTLDIIICDVFWAGLVSTDWWFCPAASAALA